MLITKPVIKDFIYDIVNYTDEVNSDGLRLPRTTFPKRNFRQILSLRKKILGQLMVDTEEGTLTYDEYLKSGKQGRLYHTDAELEITPAEKKALKELYSEREELSINMTAELLDEFEELLNSSH